MDSLINEENKKVPNNIKRIKELKTYNTKCEKSGITSHYTNLEHEMDFENYKIIDKSNSRKKLEILEMLHIKTNNNINKKEDLTKMGNLYDGLLSNIKHNKYKHNASMRSK